MSFLRVNGRQLSVSQVGRKDIDVGSRGAAVDGTPLVDRQRSKYIGSFSTPVVTQNYADMVRALIRGQGDVWPFDSDDYSNKGQPAESGAVRTIRSAAVDGDPVSDEYKFAGAVAVDSATTNILDADTRDAEDSPNGYGAINAAVLSADATHFWQGTKSLKVVTDGLVAADGAKTDVVDPGAGSATKTYAGSVYVKGTATHQVQIRLWDVTNIAGGSWVDSDSFVADTWQRVQCSITIGGVDCRSIRLEVVEKALGTVTTFYCDGFQVEEKAFATSWADGVRAAGVLEYSADSLRSLFEKDWTINVWVAPSTSTSIASIFSLSDSSGGAPTTEISIYSVGTILLGNSPGLSVTGTIANDRSWQMVTLVHRTSTETGEHALEVFVDGASDDSDDTVVSPPDLDELITFEVGARRAGGVAWYDGLIDDLLIVPYAASAAQVADWYAMAKAMSPLPRVYVDGDVISDPDWTLQAIGKLGGSKIVGAADSDGTWRNNREMVKFSLEEV